MKRLLLVAVLAAATTPAVAKSRTVEAGAASLTAIYLNWTCATAIGDAEADRNRSRITSHMLRIYGPEKTAELMAAMEAGFSANGRGRMKPGRDTTWDDIRSACREQIREALHSLDRQSQAAKK